MLIEPQAWRGKVLRQQMWRTDGEGDTNLGVFGVAGPHWMGVAPLPPSQNPSFHVEDGSRPL